MAPATTASLVEHFRCPGCAATLAQAAGGLRCSSCRARYPILGGVPILLRDPEQRLASWSGELSDSLRRQSIESRQLAKERSTPGLSASTRRRLRKLLRARRALRDQWEELYRPLRAAGSAPAVLKGASSWMPMYRNVLRDWAWGEPENRAVRRLVTPLLPRRPGRVLVLGAGGCRLAYDLHRSRRPAFTAAVDINPFELLPAARIVRGRTVALHEFPPHPRGLGEPAPLWLCRAPRPAGRGFEIVLADGRQVPARDGAFDVVLTPYFLDAVGGSTARQAGEIARLLSPNGRWINIGPLAFQNRRPAEAYGEAELLELVGAGGFQVLERRRAVVPHMQSPACGFLPSWDVLVFSARRTAAPAAVLPPARAPRWLRDAEAAPPALAGGVELLREHSLRGASLRPGAWLVRRAAGDGEELRVDDDVVGLLRRLDGRSSLKRLARAWTGRAGAAEVEAARWVLKTLLRRGYLRGGPS